MYVTALRRSVSLRVDMPARAGMALWPLMAERTRPSMPFCRRGFQALKSSMRGAPAMPVPWQLMQWDCTNCSPLIVEGEEYGLVGSTACPKQTMKAIARLISRSLRLGCPPWAGILPMPPMALSVSLFKPFLERCVQAATSPIFGAPLVPLVWQPEQTFSTTSRPVLSVAKTLVALRDKASNETAEMIFLKRGRECIFFPNVMV